MSQVERLQRAATGLCLPVAGIVMLVVIEIVRGVPATPGEAIDLSKIPPLEFLIILLCVSAVPVISLTNGISAFLRWSSFFLALLLTLFHGLHIGEHVSAGDFFVAALIIFVMFLPSLSASYQIWKAKPA